jgi:tRNA pseudouridine55 synthase
MVQGERSYARARRGESVELAEVAVVVHAIELVDYQYPEITFRTTVSAGTYVRSMGRDLGERLQTGAHLTALRREAIGDLRVEDAIPLDRLGPEAIRAPLAVLGGLTRLIVSEEEVGALRHGRSIPDRRTASPPDRPVAAVTAEQRLIAVGRVREGMFQPEVVLESAG